MKKVPTNAVPITPDREIYKTILEKGDPKNFYASYYGTCVGILYVIGSENGLIESRALPEDPVCWITGDADSEGKLSYLFLPICVKSMHEGETAKFYFTKRYFLGNAPFISVNGQVDTSSEFTATIQLLKSTPLDQITADSEKVDKKEQKSEQTSEQAPEQTSEQASEDDKNLSDYFNPNIEQKEIDKVLTQSIEENGNNNNNKNSNNSDNNNNNNVNQDHANENDNKNGNNNNINQNSVNKNDDINNNNNNVNQNHVKENDSSNNTSNSNVNQNRVNENDNNEEEKKGPKIVEIPADDENFKRRKFAINQLIIAEDLLRQPKPAAARKEYNRARMSWSTQVDLSKPLKEEARVFKHEALDLSESDLKKYIESRSLYGVARTYLAIDPPNKDKALALLREALEIDKDFFEISMTIEELGEKVEEEGFPPMGDVRLAKQQFWLNEELPWEKRNEFYEFTKKEATDLFRESNFKEALNLYTRSVLSFSGQAKKNLTAEQRIDMNTATVVSRLNGLACYLGMGEFRKLVKHADELFDCLNKTTNIDCEQFKIKCLLRKALALHEMNMEEYVEDTVKKIKQLKESEWAVKTIRKKQQDDISAHQKDQDFVYSKMTGTLK